MKKLGIEISARFFNGTTLEQAYEMVQHHFTSVTVHAKDVFTIHRNFQEAFRGYMIGQGSFKDTKTGKISGRAAITVYDDFIEETGRRDEISFSFKDFKVYGALSRRSLWCKIDCRDTWTKELIDYLYGITIVRKVEVSEREFPGEINFFYADLARRLEEGDFEGGDRRSQYRLS